jgi:choice-of-anchor B domain-containing protein
LKKLLLLSLLTAFACTQLFAQFNIDSLSRITYPNDLSNLTGYTDSAGREYALVGWFKGVSIVDVTNPASPVVLFNVPGPDNIWREIKTYREYAYVTNEGDSGLQIIDLHNLPFSYSYKWIRPLGMSTSHTVFIDENGVGYVNGPNVGVGGIIFLDLHTDPWNPTILGNYNRHYVHDCYARGDTLYAAHINDGFFSIVDVHDKSTTNDPAKTLATQNTSLNFTHNCWLSDDGRYLFTTDERPNSFLEAWDISNLSSITRVDREQSNPGSDVIIHNTYYVNGYAVTSYYRDGVTIHDVHKPDNMIEIGWYDSSPLLAGDGFNGAWGVYPFFASKNLVVSDIERGLFVLAPHYHRACYLEGVVTDTFSGNPLNGAIVTLSADGRTKSTNIIGEYKTGYRDSGYYDVTISKAGYRTKTYTHVALHEGLVTSLDVALVPVARFTLHGFVLDSLTGRGVNNATIQATTSLGDVYVQHSDTLGHWVFSNMYPSNYEILAGSWGHVTRQILDSCYLSHNYYDIMMHRGYYDDFCLDFNWMNSGTASSGAWVRAVSIGTTYNAGTGPDDTCAPFTDVNGDFDNLAMVTGNGGGAGGDDDVDNGYVTLSSPVFDISNYRVPKMSCYFWLYNGGGFGGTPNDSLKLSLTNGTDTVRVRTYNHTSPKSQWSYVELSINDYITPTSTMQFLARAEDNAPGNIVEAGIDKFYVWDSLGESTTGIMSLVHDAMLRVYPNPFVSSFTLSLDDNTDKFYFLEIRDALGRLMEFTKIKGNETLHFGASYEAGAYFIVVKDQGQVISRKKIIKAE